MTLATRLLAPIVKLKRYTVGQRAPLSGQYSVWDANGLRVAHRQVTMVKGRRFAPVRDVPGASFKLTDTTLHSKG